jgi:hypothetical protein
MLSLPKCDASKILRTNFTDATDVTIIENWVNSVLGYRDRSECFGATAVSRAIRNLRITCHYDDDLLHDGELRIVKGRQTVFIRTDQNPRRESFTLAHELGHASLHTIAPNLNQSDPGVERLCNLFAAEILMPTSFVRAVWRKTRDVDCIVTLAAQTSSSLPASCLRVVEYLNGGVTTGLASTSGVIVQRYDKAHNQAKCVTP